MHWIPACAGTTYVIVPWLQPQTLRSLDSACGRVFFLQHVSAATRLNAIPWQGPLWARLCELLAFGPEAQKTSNCKKRKRGTISVND